MMEKEKPESSLVLKAFEAAGEFVRQAQEKEAVRRAALTPQQREAEDAAIKRNQESRQAEKLDKDRQRMEVLYEKWWAHETWDVDSEAIPLALGCDPNDGLGVFAPVTGSSRLRKLVDRAEGVSLTLYPPVGFLGGKRVKPAEFVHFLIGKGEVLPEPLRMRVTPPVPAMDTKATPKPEGRTAAANRTREQQKRDRQKALREFKVETDNRAQKRGTVIDWSAVPVTKGDFLKVFFRVKPGLAKKFGRATFENDFADIGIKFKNGTKHQESNVLDSLWRPVKEG